MSSCAAIATVNETGSFSATSGGVRADLLSKVSKESTYFGAISAVASAQRTFGAKRVLGSEIFAQRWCVDSTYHC